VTYSKQQQAYIDAAPGNDSHHEALRIIGELEKQLAAAEAEVARLRAGLERLGSVEAFESWETIGLETRARFYFARQLLESPDEKGQAKP
jgi:uncharacterized small protein (DUF1192 family)